MMLAPKQHTPNGVSRVFHWIVDKMLPWALMLLIGVGINMWTWRVGVDKDLHYLNKYIEEEEDSIAELEARIKVLNVELAARIKVLNVELAALNSQLPRSHVNREEFKEHTRQLERRIDNLERLRQDSNK